MGYSLTCKDGLRPATGEQDPRHGFAEKKMFGEVSFLPNRKMCFGVKRDDLVVRVGPKIYEKALARPHARPMDFMGKSMKGFVYVGSK